MWSYAQGRRTTLQSNLEHEIDGNTDQDAQGNFIAKQALGSSPPPLLLQVITNVRESFLPSFVYSLNGSFLRAFIVRSFVSSVTTIAIEAQAFGDASCVSLARSWAGVVDRELLSS